MKRQKDTLKYLDEWIILLGENGGNDMQINLSDESLNVIVNSLRDSKRSLKSQIDKCIRIDESTKAEICKNQLKDVENTLSIFEEIGY